MWCAIPIGSSVIRGSDACPYRSKEEEIEWKARCPISTFHAQLIKDKVLTAAGLEKLEAEVAQIVENAVEFGLASPYPEESSLKDGIYA